MTATTEQEPATDVPGRIRVEVGDQRVEQVVDDLKRTQIVMYAGASADFNPLHTDEVYAREIAGHPTVMAHGMLVMGLAGRVLTDWFGHENVRRFRARFQAPTWPGDALTVTATVTEVRDDSAGGRLAEIQLSCVAAPDRRVLAGSATVAVG
ncbi:Acyl dehydratase [Pseudonocardia thermophila]|jgi:Acyl dehydratase|uniref:Acyl dehydratase n=1 Tax=Pseudonocardia thermophila TaxID=1848 RepID=A0A1M6XZJ9_PSETH|nr:MaoC/PaaZ C-terminal domain-containing protein [Pseudonocardia thermophila]SHL11397.1 Acyl dehydratase [Pseudonocardia thermophila]